MSTPRMGGLNDSGPSLKKPCPGNLSAVEEGCWVGSPPLPVTHSMVPGDICGAREHDSLLHTVFPPQGSGWTQELPHNVTIDICGCHGNLSWEQSPPTLKPLCPEPVSLQKLPLLSPRLLSMTQVGEPKPDLLVTGSATLDLVIPGSCLVPIQSQVAPEVSTTAGFLVVLSPDWECPFPACLPSKAGRQKPLRKGNLLRLGPPSATGQALTRSLD